MFRTAFDPTTVLRVSRVGPPSNRTDFDEISRCIEASDRETTRSSRPPVHVLIVEGAVETNASDRKRFAQVAMNLKAPRLVFALVTTSLIHRGTLRAITWLAPPPSGHRVSAFASLDEARVWIVSEIKDDLPSLPLLVARVGYQS